ncbi:MAG: EAL domain-containing protein [Hyphomicrobiaceae bacterium]|nr:EAL domain-containing protein [Hyphomicrobiaceae bacterium]
MATDSKKARGRRSGGKAGDAVVMMAMALVTLALCAGLVLQAGLGFWLAGTVSLSFYLGLLTLHAIVRRSGQLEELRAEVERLKAALGAPDGSYAAQPGVAAAAPAASVAPGAGPGAAPGVASGDRSRRGAPAGAVQVQGQSPALAATPPALPQRVEPPLAQQAAAGNEPVSAPAPTGPEFTARMQRVVRGAPAGDATHTSASVQQAGPAGTHNVVKSSPPLRKPLPQQPQATNPPPVTPQHAQVPTIATASSAFSDPPTEIGIPAHRSAASADVPASPREADVEMIQGLIKKLAEEVNAAEAEKLAAPVRATAEPRTAGDARLADTRAIEESVGALKRAAATMKQPARSDMLPGEGLDASRDRREPEAAPAPQAAAQARSHTAPEPEPEPEFDFDTLMRRAQPIAAMTDSAGDERTDAPSPAPGYVETDPRLERAAAALAPAFAAPGASQSPPATDFVSPPDQTDEATAHAVSEESEERLEMIAAALDAGRVEVYLEPILDLARQQPSHYEVSVRLCDEEGDEIIPLATADDGTGGLEMPLLDSIRLSRTAQVAQMLEERRKPGAVFSTFNGPSLASDDFLSAFAETYEGQQGLAAQLVLTFAQSDIRRFRAPHWAMVEEMRELGFRFAMRAVTDLDMDFEPLVGAGFTFIKLDAEVFLEGLPTPGGVIPPADLCNHLAGLGLSLVVEHIDDEARRARLSAFGVVLGQGQLFGGPRLMKAAAFSSTQRAA